MRIGNYLESISRAFVHNEKICKQQDAITYHFLQTWGSTSLGFDGIGGQAMSEAYTTVIVHNECADVYFNGRFAYSVNTMNENFIADLNNRNMRSVSQHQIFYINQ